MVGTEIEPFVAVRRALIAVFAAEKRLLAAAQSRLPKTNPLFKQILKLCRSDATRQMRHLCDRAICQFADIHGDDMFRDAIVDDMHIPAATHFFYGISSLIPEERVAQDRTRRLTAADIEKLEDVFRLGIQFVGTASALPHIPRQAFARWERPFEQSVAKTRKQVEKHALLYTGYRCLSERLCPGLAASVLAFCE